ncbi:MAG: DUF2283 domain-containing protein [Chloroflexi bacterium]|nr:DUF2283 domain-containing protein [Chloroflexota bacterium]
MDTATIQLVKQALPLLLRYQRFDWDYDEEADVLYVTFNNTEATDSDLTGDDIVLRYREDELIGVTVLHASTRGAALPAK